MNVSMPLQQHSLADEADHISEVAAEIGRHARSHASDATDDATRAASRHAADASSWLNDLVGELIKAVAAAGAALALSGRRTANDVNRNAKSVAGDLRKVRITTEPPPASVDFTPGITLLAGFGAGLALMYFLDPNEGRRRRNLLMEQLTSWTRRTSKAAAGTARDLSSRAQDKIPVMRSSVDDMADTQTWPASDTQSPSGDGSTTDTQTEQPQPASSGLSAS